MPSCSVGLGARRRGAGHPDGRAARWPSSPGSPAEGGRPRRCKSCRSPIGGTGSWCCSGASTPTRGTACARRAPGPDGVRGGRAHRGAHQRRRRLGRTCSVGQPVLISDHLNLTARSPLVGPAVRRPDRRVLAAPAGAGPRDRPDARRGRLRRPARVRTTRRRPRSGCCGRSAPTWSACRRCTRPSRPARPAPTCSGMSLVTNLAAGITGEPLDHTEVLAAGGASAARMGALLADWSSTASDDR